MASTADQLPRRPDCLLSLWFMTEGAIESSVFLVKGKDCGAMGIAGKERGFVTCFSVAVPTIRPRGPCPKLPLVCVLMAVRAKLMLNGTVEVAVAMALGATLVGVFAFQWELREGMVEIATGPVARPSSSVMT